LETGLINGITAIDSAAALKDLIKQYLEKRGYKTSEGVKLTGKSGTEHTFDMLAKRDAGFVSHSIGVAVLPDGDEKTRINFLHTCANRDMMSGCPAQLSLPSVR